MPPAIAAVAGIIYASLTAIGVSAYTAAAIGVFLAQGIVYGGINLVVGLAANSIRGAFSKKPLDPGRTVSVRQPAAPRRVIYGRSRVGGTVTFMHISPRGDSPNNDLHIVYTLSGHPLHSIDHILFNGKQLNFGTKDANPPFPGHNVGYFMETGAYANNLWMQKRNGNLGDDLFTGLDYATQQDSSDLWPVASHRQDGCGSVELLHTWNTNVYPNGIPPTLFDVHGKELFDFRDGTTGYSENVALAIYDYLTNKEYGLGAESTEINLPSFIAAANTCDENVSLKAGGTEDRYTVNGTFTTDANPEDVLKALANAMAGYIVYSQGQWTAVAGIWTSSVLTLTDDDLRAPLKSTHLRSKRDLCNGVKGTIYTPLRNWQHVDFPPVYHPEHVCDDSGFPNANQTGAWATSTPYSVDDAAIDISARQLKGKWVTGTSYVINDYVSDGGFDFVCIANNTAASTNEPGVGVNTATYWVDVTADYSAAVGAIFVCIVAHTSSTATRPGRGAQWATYWAEAKELIWRDLDLAFTISPSMAQRIAKIELERVRRQATIMLPCKLTAFPIQPGDVISFTHGRYSWSGKTFQAIQTEFAIDQDADGNPIVGINVYANETDASVFAWDPSSEEQDLGTPAQPTMPDQELPGRDFFVYGPGMTYASTTSSITWTFDYTGGNAIILLDNQNTEFTPSGSQAVTGLSANTHYWWYPYYNRLLDAISFLIEVSAGIGTPPWAQAVTADANLKRARIAEWQRDGHLALALTPIDAATTSSGGGGGGGGGDGGCLRTGMLVMEKDLGVITCQSVKVGQELWAPGGWLKVYEVRKAPHDLWCEVKFNNGAVVMVTTKHPFTLAADGEIKRAAALCLEDAIPTPTGIAYPESIRFVREQSEKVPIGLAEPHTFYASSDGENWVLTHNTGIGNQT